MLDFTYNIPTKIIFGRDRVDELAQEIKNYSDRVLLVYGGGSIKKIGLYQHITDLFEKHSIVYEELSGVKPNPSLESVHKGIEICRDNALEMVVAVGGGSVIDCAKAIACGVYYDGDVWDFFRREAPVGEALPVGSVLTLAATGSEMNGNSVITNEQTEEKLHIGSLNLVPRFSFLDPQHTFSVPESQTMAGSIDIFVHILEVYFSRIKEAFLQDRMAEALLKTVIHYAPVALKDPDNYEARSNLMWASSLAINGLIAYGKTGDWATHLIEHEISAFYDLTHGVGLAIVEPHWMQYVLDADNAYKFAEYARNVWDVDEADEMKAAKQGILKTAEFFQSLGAPLSLEEAGIDGSKVKQMAEKAVAFGPIGDFRQLEKKDVEAILKNCL